MARSEPVGGGPKGKAGFPIGDKKHARLAIGGATRSFNVGNISKSKENEVKSEARAKLGHGMEHTGRSVRRGEDKKARNDRLDRWAGGM